MKNKYLLVLGLLSTCLISNAQFFNFKLKTNNRQLIEEAIEQSIVNVNQYYILIDTVTNQRLGRNDEDFFNKISYPGIISEEGVILESSNLKPWNDDKDYAKYEGKYKPEISKTEIVINKNPVNPLDSTIIKEDGEIVILTVPDQNGIKIDSSIGEKDGWIVWVSTDKDGKKELTSFTQKVNITENREPISVEKPEELENIEIGYLFTSNVSGPGQITFQLVGIAVEKANSWVITFPFTEEREESILTPLKDNETINQSPKSSKKK